MYYCLRNSSIKYQTHYVKIKKEHDAYVPTCLPSKTINVFQFVCTPSKQTILQHFQTETSHKISTATVIAPIKKSSNFLKSDFS